MKLLLDEHISPGVARAMRDRGHDVVAVAERRYLRGAKNVDVLSVAATEGRVTVTADVGDFSRRGRDRLPDQRWHAGIILASSTTFSLSVSGTGSLVRALESLMVARVADDLSGEVVWLGRAPDEDRQP